MSLQEEEWQAGAELCQAHASLDLLGFDWIFNYFDCLTAYIYRFLRAWNKKILNKKISVQKNVGPKTISSIRNLIKPDFCKINLKSSPNMSVNKI